jgi:hypothetical protein
MSNAFRCPQDASGLRNFVRLAACGVVFVSRSCGLDVTLPDRTCLVSLTAAGAARAAGQCFEASGLRASEVATAQTPRPRTKIREHAAGGLLFSVYLVFILKSAQEPTRSQALSPCVAEFCNQDQWLCLESFHTAIRAERQNRTLTGQAQWRQHLRRC